jgi:hypothetical protein
MPIQHFRSSTTQNGFWQHGRAGAEIKNSHGMSPDRRVIQEELQSGSIMTDGVNSWQGTCRTPNVNN